jgi:hypothetical protein
MRARSNVLDTRDQDVGMGRVAAHKPDPLTALPRGNIVRLHASAHQGTIAEKSSLDTPEKRSRVCRNRLARNK